MKKLLLAASILLGSHGAASAFTSADNDSLEGDFGSNGCKIRLNISHYGPQAFLYVVPANDNFLMYFPGGYDYWDFDNDMYVKAELTAEIVGLCLNTTVTDFTPVASTGSFATQTHMGFSFTVESEVGAIAGFEPVDGT
jgi:hypothetical protein